MLLSANRICICGLGNSHAIAEDIQHKLMRLGLNATAYVVHAAEIALEGGASVISLTNVGRSPLADISTIALHTASNETRYRRVALSSRIAQMAIVDVLYTMIALKKPDTADGFFKIEKELVNTKY